MRVISKKALKEHWEKPSRGDSKIPLETWHAMVLKANWQNTGEKAQFGAASIVSANRIVWNVRGNKYRLIAHINFAAQILFVRFVGTHQEYDQINAETI